MKDELRTTINNQKSKIKNRINVLFRVGLWIGGCLWPTGGLQAQTPPTSPPQAESGATYRLRVENGRFGRVEMSADAGKTYVLVGRVLREATSATPNKAVKTPGTVLRAGRDGMAFGVAPGLTLKLRPQWAVKPPSPGNKKGAKVRPPATEPSAMVTDIPVDEGIFGSLAPPSGTPVRMQRNPGEPEPIPTGYSPSETDVFVFLVTLPKPPAEGAATLAQRIEMLSKAYADGAAARAQAAKRKVVSGMLTLRAKLPEGEPDPIDAVTYMADGELLAAQNTPPFSYSWDTSGVPDGEHVVEIRAFNKTGRMLTRARALVVVQNTPAKP
jgi:hypothetical protein